MTDDPFDKMPLARAREAAFDADADLATYEILWTPGSVTRAVFHPGPFSVTYRQSGRIQRYLMKDGEWEAQPPEDVVAGKPVRRDETGVIQRVVNLGDGDLEADKDQEGGRSKVWP
ncbi:hypothetical protein GXW78_00635 [Roseomonas terrae]|uniref:Uncharacterized protein n=1 Tax=Neoroseomonas terrae TaxID=424799 RepID=A0ABS5EAW1_9PROT|nr:hypothetical protein [Neoroseomonas terrae]MBR0648153.1 hypothetical protein [Neoroseomonas terrae]